MATAKRSNSNNGIRKITLKSGDELGRFRLGSTAIVLFGPDVVKWKDGLQEGSPTAMGEQIATLA